jgi:hypothetical protein
VRRRAGVRSRPSSGAGLRRPAGAGERRAQPAPKQGPRPGGTQESREGNRAAWGGGAAAQAAVPGADCRRPAVGRVAGSGLRRRESGVWRRVHGLRDERETQSWAEVDCWAVYSIWAEISKYRKLFGSKFRIVLDLPDYPLNLPLRVV